MNIDEMLQQTGAVEAISRELGVDASTARAGASALLPSILAGLRNPASASSAPGSATPDLGGLGGLLGTIGGLGGGALLDNVTSRDPTDIGRGNAILGELFGSKDGSRAVAADAAAHSGVQPTLLKRMLPILAMAAAGYVMQRAGQGQSGIGGTLGGMFGGASGGAGEGAPATGAQAGQGGILDDLIGAAGRFLGGQR